MTPHCLYSCQSSFYRVTLFFIKAYFTLIQYVDDYLRQRKDIIRIFVIFRVRHVKPLQLGCDSMNEHVSEMVYL